MGITRILKNHLRSAAIRIHPQPKATDIKSSVKTFLPNALGVLTVIGTGMNLTPVRHRDIGSDVAMIHIPLPAWPRHHRMKSVIMGATMKPSCDDLFLVDLGVKHIITVYVGINVDVWCHGDH